MSGEAKFILKIFLILAVVGFGFWYLAFQSSIFSKSTYLRVGSGTIESENAVVLIGAGDISDCEEGEKVTVPLLSDADIVFTLGDNMHHSAKLSDYIKCFGKYWGKYKDIIRPALGNHDYETDNAAGFFSYFGDKVGPAGKGYYSYDAGNWHIVVLNSNCDEVAGCGSDSPQISWLKADLASNKKKCVLAYWHHPLFNSGRQGGYIAVKNFWRVLYEHDAEIVLNGHEHGYERFSPQSPSGKPDPRGIRQFIVGTGGYDHSGFMEKASNSELRNYDTFGVLKLVLAEDKYSWEFIPEKGQSFTDKGEAACVES